MLLDQKKFYQDIASYYELDNYEDLQVYLDHKEQEVKQSVMPDPGCVMSVSYTHLDVYKRQVPPLMLFSLAIIGFGLYSTPLTEFLTKVVTGVY